MNFLSDAATHHYLPGVDYARTNVGSHLPYHIGLREKGGCASKKGHMCLDKRKFAAIRDRLTLQPAWELHDCWLTVNRHPSGPEPRAKHSPVPTAARAGHRSRSPRAGAGLGSIRGCSRSAA